MKWTTAILAVNLSMLRHLGGLGLLVVGILGDSMVPLPGAIDGLTVVLSAANREWWMYYALLAAGGSVIGGYLGYRIGRKGGKETLERRLSRHQQEKVYAAFRKGGFGAVFVPALMPPPLPLMPFVMAAGALNYPVKTFLMALASARLLRFGLVAYLGSRYGRWILRFFAEYYQPLLITLLALALAGGVVAAVYLYRHKARQAEQGSKERKRAA